MERFFLHTKELLRTSLPHYTIRRLLDAFPVVYLCSNVCLFACLIVCCFFTDLPEESRSMNGWRKEMRPKGFLLSVNPSSSKETDKIFNIRFISISEYFDFKYSKQTVWTWWSTLTCEWGRDTHVCLQTSRCVPGQVDIDIENCRNEAVHGKPCQRAMGQYVVENRQPVLSRPHQLYMSA